MAHVWSLAVFQMGLLRKICPLTPLKNVYADSLLLEGQVLKLVGGASLKIVFTLNADSQSQALLFRL